MEDSPLAARIRERLSALDMSARAASTDAGLSPDTLGKILTGASRNLRGDNLHAVATVLKTTPEWLVTGEEQESEHGRAIKGVLYGGIVEAGAFRHNDLSNQDAEFRVVPLAPSPLYPSTKQFAFEGIGDSMNQANIVPGMWVQGVDLHAWSRLHGEPGDGKLVVVARTRTAGNERELTVKRLRVFRDRVELWPDSTNPNHQKFVYPLASSRADGGGVEIQIIAVVIAATKIFT